METMQQKMHMNVYRTLASILRTNFSHKKCCTKVMRYL